jgi:hypothetical protein
MTFSNRHRDPGDDERNPRTLRQKFFSCVDAFGLRHVLV